jgi:hypothetical protein
MGVTGWTNLGRDERRERSAGDVAHDGGWAKGKPRDNKSASIRPVSS